MKTPKTIEYLNRLELLAGRVTYGAEQLAYDLRFNEPVDKCDAKDFARDCEELIKLLAKHYRCNFSRVDA